MSYPYPGQHSPNTNVKIASAKGDALAARMAQEAEETAARHRAQNQQQSIIPAGQMTPEQWRAQFQQGQTKRIGIDPFAGPQGPTPTGEPLTSPSAASTPPSASPTNRVDPFARTQGDRDAHFENLPSTGNAPPPDPSWQARGTGREGVVIPDSGRNYKGEKSYIDPYAGPTIDVDPSKDQRFSLYGQTSGAQTAQGISDKYRVPGTAESFTPGTVTDANGATMAQNGVVTPAPPQTPDRAALYAAHPEVFRAGTPENIAFVNHVKDYGEDSAHANIDDLMAAAKTQPTPASAALNPTADNAATAIPNSAKATENIATNSARQGAGGGPKLQPY